MCVRNACEWEIEHHKIHKSQNTQLECEIAQLKTHKTQNTQPEVWSKQPQLPQIPKEK